MNFWRRHLWWVAILSALAVMFALGFVWAVMLLPDARLAEYHSSHPGSAGHAAAPVWVNTATGVYHMHTSRWYGRTLTGKFVTEQEAIAEGDRPARGGH